MALRLVFAPAACAHRLPDDNDDYGPEIVCVREIPDASALGRVVPEAGVAEVLWVERTNQRRLALYTLLFWLIAMAFVWCGYVLLWAICGEVGDCYVFSAPMVYGGCAVAVFLLIVRVTSSPLFYGRVSGVVNGVAFLIQRKVQGVAYALDTTQGAKTYYKGFACPITLLHCRWQRGGALPGGSYIKLACCTLPHREEALLVPVLCDAIDLVRAAHQVPPVYANHLGLLAVLVHNSASLSHVSSFLLGSGFTIVAMGRGLLIAIRRMGGRGEWDVQSVEGGGDVQVVRLRFISAAPAY
jgi:hypothetical protein